MIPGRHRPNSCGEKPNFDMLRPEVLHEHVGPRRQFQGPLTTFRLLEIEPARLKTDAGVDIQGFVLKRPWIDKLQHFGPLFGKRPRHHVACDDVSRRQDAGSRVVERPDGTAPVRCRRS